jgi:hypothetical protein
MKAQDLQFTQLLEGSKQFIIPIFQRTYSWERSHCEQLWLDIMRVMLDSDLAKLYGVSTSRFNEAVKQNRSRFPDDFAYPVTKEYVAILISQNARSNAPDPPAKPLGFGVRERRARYTTRRQGTIS